MSPAGGARGRGAAPRYRYVLKSAIFFISTDYLSHRSGFQNMGGQGLLALPEEYYLFAKFTPRFPWVCQGHQQNIALTVSSNFYLLL